jgi:uncharacterized protein (DUF58 family)
MTMPTKRDKRKSKLRLPLEGWSWLAVSALLLGLGIYKGINLLCLLAYAMLGVLVLNVLVVGRGMRRLRGQRRINGPVFAGTPFTVELQASNPRRGPLLGFSLEDAGPERMVSSFVPRLAGLQSVTPCHEATLPRRGRHAWGALTASRGYPFGLVRRRVRLAPGEVVVVLPRLGRLHRGRLRRYLQPAGLAGAWTRNQPRRHPTAQSEFHGLRAFRSGDSPRWIHWRTSARCGELMVREFEDVPTDNLILVLDPFSAAGNHPSPAGQESKPPGADSLLEDTISLAATICWEWCRRRGDQIVLAVASSLPVVQCGATSHGHAIRMLEALAELTGEPTPDAGPVLDRLAGMALPPATVMLISPREAAPLQAALSERLHRRVVALDVSALADFDFYESPSGP